jgi:hypothetical protein
MRLDQMKILAEGETTAEQLGRAQLLRLTAYIMTTDPDFAEQQTVKSPLFLLHNAWSITVSCINNGSRKYFPGV